MIRRHAILAIFLVAATGAAQAQLKVQIPAVADTPVDNLVRVLAPSARCAAVSDRLNLVVMGHHSKHTAAHVSLFRLDDSGKPAATLIALKLPRPEGLSRLLNVPLSLAFHPKLPLLYVWQDIEILRTPQNEPVPLTAAELAAVEQLDHLLIYSVDKEQPELAVALCRGAGYGFGYPAGSLAIDPAAERLYLPNLRGHPKSKQTLIGSFTLEADGLPLLGKDTAERQPSERTAHIAALKTANGADTSILPQRIAPQSHEAFNGDIASGAGFGHVHLAKDVVLVGGYHTTALITWRPDDRLANFNSFLGNDGGYKYYYVCGHPTLPLVYSAPLNTSSIYRFEHVDGLPTLVPQQAELAAAVLRSPPVMLGKSSKLAFGGQGRVFLLNLNDQGRIKPERQQTLIGNQAVEALVYSEKFERLYVGTDKEKEK